MTTTHRFAALAALTASTAGLLLTTGLAATGSAYAADVSTCAGQPATIVGTPGHAVHGTSGPDVIVATDPTTIKAGDGDDLVCVLTSGRTYLKPTVDLGAGADTYLGPGHIATVLDAGDSADVRKGRAPSTDHITTGDLRDLVRTGADGHPDHDVIALGDAGDSRNRVYLSGVPAGSITSGAETEGLSELRLDDSHRHAWAIDLQAGTVSVDGGEPTVASGFGQLTARDLTWSSLTVTGTTAPGFVDLGRSSRHRGPVAVHLGPGADYVRAPAAVSGLVDLGGVAAGGSGRDEIDLTGADTLRPSSRVSVRIDDDTRVDGRAGLRVADADVVLLLHVASARLTGTAAAEQLEATGCGAAVHGAGGDDSIRLIRAGHCRGTGTFAAYGNAGDDELLGTPGADRLIGGPGVDEACGHGGHDLIRVELRC